ncbi:hypothetical protein BURMUCF2_0824 [Burkholderia multivorans CF2]|nr:hypothetical protein BURMUCF2_0824 [Burkholderia multivorans CF2]
MPLLGSHMLTPFVHRVTIAAHARRVRKIRIGPGPMRGNSRPRIMALVWRPDCCCRMVSVTAVERHEAVSAHVSIRPTAQDFDRSIICT